MPEPTCSIDDCNAPVSAKGFCKPHYSQDYYRRTREHQRAQRRTWYVDNAEKIKRKRREDYAADPAKFRARAAAWKADHPEYFADYWAKYYHRNRAQHLAAAKAWYQANRDAAIARAGEWAAANPEKRQEIRRRYKQSERGRLVDLASVHVRMARKRNAPGRATPEQLIARWNYFGGRCWMCWGPADQWDHVIPLSGGGSNWPSNLRPACRCNQKKGAKRMAITAASFVPEERKGGAGGAGAASAAHGSPMHGESAGYNDATDAAMSAMHESMPKSHPVTHTALPDGTGAGKGTVRRGGRGGR